MAKEEDLWGRLYDKEEEEKLIWDSIRAEVRYAYFRACKNSFYE